MQLYAGIDLHSNSNHLAIIDAQDKPLLQKRLVNDHKAVLEALAPFADQLKGIVVESTFNWYWLVDTLMDNDYTVHLANPAALQSYTGLKHRDDKHDALWLAHLLRLGILKTGYIYPKQDRPLRDLLRKRSSLVRQRTMAINNLQAMISRHFGKRLATNKIKQVTRNHVVGLFMDESNLQLSAEVSKVTIDCLTRQIRRIERSVVDNIKLRSSFSGLQTIPGVGIILSLTIMLEAGAIERFPKVGNFSSYCRKVTSKWTSNDSYKGKGNRKNGNKYLAWAFSEAAELARRYDQDARQFYNRKLSRSNRLVAHNALAHKLARAAYYIMRDQVGFDSKRLFC
jgi:transposase